MEEREKAWPLVDGEPAGKIAVWAEEKIGLENYSNVTIGSSYAHFIKDGTKAEIYAAIQEAGAIVETFVAEQRAKVLESVKAK